MAKSSFGNHLDWKFIQSFGDDNSNEDDLVTAVEFDETGEFLAVGDKAGRICIFESHTTTDLSTLLKPDERKQARSPPIEYKFYTEFQSHEAEFDCLKSLEIGEKINMVKWGKRQGSGLFVLATNDKTIKLWKVHENKIKKVQRPAPQLHGGAGQQLVIPSLSLSHSQTCHTPKRTFSNAHGYHINSISINSDGETFISTDDLRINLWNMEVSHESFNIVDVKPCNLEELTEVITSATFHPTHCNLLIHSSSRGSIRLVDLRDSALCDHHSKLYEVEEDPSSKSFFSEIISSICDIKFTPDGNHILSRDYLTMKMWDVRMENRPVSSIPVHDYLTMYLCDLYENDCIFDKFECAVSPDGKQFLTGSYNNHFVIHDTETNDSLAIEALKDPPPRNVNSASSAASLSSNTSTSSNQTQSTPDNPNVNFMDFGKKALHVDWHPSADVVAVAGLNKLYVYEA
mmetsp:Transcript_39838/g.78313  ORF Transcript_39838/g.78313 Transcript_39838/m.78313 type:complete len:458 (+) Transcript_39838:56-1429(+)